MYACAFVLARLEHPAIAAIYQLGKTDEGQPFFVMELVQGKPLDEYFAERPALTGMNFNVAARVDEPVASILE